jgi:choline dehydrogenase-like flavoprotein
MAGRRAGHPVRKATEAPFHFDRITSPWGAAVGRVSKGEVVCTSGAARRARCPHHPVGTCRTGRDVDAALDPQLRPPISVS